MKIPLRNTFLNLELRAFTSPRLNKLRRELEDFFERNPIQGHQIKRFSIDGRDIIPEDPDLEGALSGEGDYSKRIEEIGRKYGIRNLGLIYYCYGK